MEQRLSDLIGACEQEFKACGLDIDDIHEIVKAAKAVGVNNFVNTQIGAFESGFINTSDLTLFNMYQYARQHVKDNYDMEATAFSEQWGVDMIRYCSGGRCHHVKE